jgi:hypothetical protein
MGATRIEIGTSHLSIPSNSEYSIPQLKMMLKQVESIIGIIITPDIWENL